MMTKIADQIISYFAACDTSGGLPTIAGLALALGYRDISALLTAAARRRELRRALLQLQDVAQVALLRTPAGARYYLELYFARPADESMGDIVVRLVDNDEG